MVSLKKSVICAGHGKVLGQRWSSGGYFRADDKQLKAVLELPSPSLAGIPRASLYGLLSYFRPYVADFAVRTAPLRQLLSSSHAKWTEEHTKVVRSTIQAILEGLPVVNFDPDEVVRVQYKVGPAGFAEILL